VTRQTVFGRRREGRVLVVHDDTHRGPMITKLTAAGYEVLEATDGQEALRLLRLGDNPFLVDTILFDILPREGGEASVRHFRVHYPSVPIIVLSRSLNVNMAITLLKLGVAEYLVRPTSTQDVLDIVRQTVEQRIA
jgi:DNA-binding response OmpR family regulator